jgi:hypothetical protein
MIEIIDFDNLDDGGTIKITTDEGIFCFDDRLMSTTKGRLYYGYPMDDNSNLIENSEELEYRIIKSLKSYKNETYQKSLDHLVKSKLHLLRDDIIEDILN